MRSRLQGLHFRFISGAIVPCVMIGGSLLLGCSTLESGSFSDSGISITVGEDGGSDGGPALECPDEPVCGDGVVQIDEGCDDADDHEGDGCTSTCLRPSPMVFEAVPLELTATPTATFDVDGSVVVAGGNAREVVRLGVDGTELWRSPLELPLETTEVHVAGIFVGAEVLVVGNYREGGPWSGARWKLAADGTPLDFTVGDSNTYHAARTPDGNLARVVLDGDEKSVRVETLDGVELWSRAADPVTLPESLTIAAPSEEVVFATGASTPLGGATLVRFTADDLNIIELDPPDYPQADLHALAPVSGGGLIAAGDASGVPLLVRFDAEGQPIWSTTCSATYAHVAVVALTGDRISIGGFRSPGESCHDADTDSCEPAQYVWAQHFAVDGTLLGMDEVVTYEGYESLVAMGTRPEGQLIGLAAREPGSNTAGVFVVQFR